MPGHPGPSNQCRRTRPLTTCRDASKCVARRKFGESTLWDSRGSSLRCFHSPLAFPQLVCPGAFSRVRSIRAPPHATGGAFASPPSPEGVRSYCKRVKFCETRTPMSQPSAMPRRRRVGKRISTCGRPWWTLMTRCSNIWKTPRPGVWVAA
jgi:hypothetical protein